MKILSFSLYLFIFVGSLRLFAIEVPENCIKSEKSPCLVKDLSHFSIRGHLFKPTKETLLKIHSYDPLKIELLYGTFRLHVSKVAEISIDQLILKQSDLVYYKKNSQSYHVMKSSDLDFMTLVRSQGGANEYVVDKYELLNKKEFARFVALFYLNKSEYESDLKSLSVLYKIKLEAESEKEIAIIQKNLNRKIASEEAEEQRKQMQRLKIKSDQEKTRQQFFQRTFLQ